jgi:hypothetical protein
MSTFSPSGKYVTRKHHLSSKEKDNLHVGKKQKTTSKLQSPKSTADVSHEKLQEII